MIEIQFTKQGIKDLKKLPLSIQKRIGKKLTFFSAQQDPLVFSKPLINLPPATHRFRIGDYRIAFYKDGSILHIDKVRHRRDVYTMK